MVRKIRIQVGPRFGELRNGKVRYELKTPYRDGTTHVIFEPLDLNAEPRTSANNYRDSGAGCWASRTSRSSVPG